jgi:hypothetical protein
MNQPHLLELAKQGESTAIAALMNAVLNTQEIQAQVGLEGHCLGVLLKSSKALNQEAIVTFVRRGLDRLDIERIDTVKICSQEIGKSSFSWVREFELQPVVQPVSKDRSEDLEDSLDLDEAEFEEQQTESEVSIPSYFRAYSVLFGVAVVVGFMSGGTMATLISTSQAANQTAATETEGGLLGENVSKQTPQEKQQKAESYLKAMNAAQTKFFDENKRFASSLEELERSTNLISQSYDYAYKLKIANASRAEIAAISKAGGLRSYVGVVAVTGKKTANIICKAKQLSAESLPVPESSKTLKCPSRSAQVD